MEHGSNGNDGRAEICTRLHRRAQKNGATLKQVRLEGGAASFLLEQLRRLTHNKQRQTVHE